MGSIWTGTTAPAEPQEGDIWICPGGGVAEVIPSLWAKSILHKWGIQSAADERRRAELRWLRASLEADCLPDWCIEMVMENW